MKEAQGHLLGVSDTVGDAMTFDVYSEKNKKVVQRSVIRPDLKMVVSPITGLFGNVEDEDLNTDNETIIATDMSALSPCQNTRKHTNEHEVKWHDTIEASKTKQMTLLVSQTP